MTVIAESLAVIDAGPKAIELWERLGPTGGGLQALNLTYDPSEFKGLASQIETDLDEEYGELFKGTKDRVAQCIRSLNQAANDETYLPEQRRKFGKAARMCVCREIAIIQDLLAGELPQDLENLWAKHKCSEARAPMVAGA